MVERPLFYEGRKPPAEPTSDNEQTVEISQLDDWQLVGIYNRDKQQMALFSKKNEPKTILKVSASALVSGWSLKEIQSDRVILWQSGQTKTILLRKPRADVPVPPVQRPAPNRPGLAPSNRPGVPRIAKPVMQPTPNSENASDDNKN